MVRTRKSASLFGLLAFLLVLLLCGSVFAQNDRGLEGWEKGSEYDQNYDVSEFDQFKGTVEEVVDVTPLPGMAPGVGLVVRDQDEDLVKVQVGPKSFVNLDSISLKKGDKVKVKGAWAEINGEEVFMASKIKKGEFVEVKVRKTSDGTPFWSMTPEQLAKETEGQEE